jgi:SHS2 domain-containing protein
MTLEEKFDEAVNQFEEACTDYSTSGSEEDLERLELSKDQLFVLFNLAKVWKE